MSEGTFESIPDTAGDLYLLMLGFWSDVEDVDCTSRVEISEKIETSRHSPFLDPDLYETCGSWGREDRVRGI